jgi:hypothetical protein
LTRRLTERPQAVDKAQAALEAELEHSAEAVQEEISS